MRRGDDERAAYDLSDRRQVPNYRRLLANSGNKAALALYLSGYLVEHEEFIPEVKTLVLAGGFNDYHSVTAVTQLTATPLHDLESSHEEADSRLIRHAIDKSCCLGR